ncbi:MAG: DNA-binding response regulator [Cellvibrionaceae bacterium]|nr:DNA-binding response regulator [Cellvibrionaceae bacterium]
MKIAMLEDDQQQAQLVKGWLEEIGHQVTHRDNGTDFLAACRREPFDLAILDWELPDQTGVDVLTMLRQSYKQTLPVLFATQRDNEEDVVNALSAGADDYLVKPLRQKELSARLAALSRRAGIDTPAERLQLGPIEIDTQAIQARVDGELVKLTQKEFDVAVLFMRNIGKVLSREYLLRQVWGVDAALNTRTVDVHVSKVRRCLGINPDMGFCITTIYQHGYRLEAINS